MPRKKMKPEDKKINFGITIHPEILELLEKQSKKENKSKSKLIEDVMKEHFKNKDDNDND